MKTRIQESGVRSQEFQNTKYKIQNTKFDEGMTLVEVLVSMAIAVTIVTSIVVLGIMALRTADMARRRASVLFYTKEGIETVRMIRDNRWNVIDAGTRAWDWATLTNGFYRLEKVGNVWQIVKVANTLPGVLACPDCTSDLTQASCRNASCFILSGTDNSRMVQIDQVCRDVSGNIGTCGVAGFSNDSNSRKIIVKTSSPSNFGPTIVIQSDTILTSW